jgi:hypothetical protein
MIARRRPTSKAGDRDLDQCAIGVESGRGRALEWHRAPNYRFQRTAGPRLLRYLARSGSGPQPLNLGR